MQAVTPDKSTVAPTILFGAFDRHNFGDLLFPHIAAALLEEKNLVFAGLVERDLRACGGHHVEALADVTAQWRDHPVNIIHVGGELLTCSAWEAAVMTLQPDEARAAISRFDAHSRAAREWAQETLGQLAMAPYTVQRTLFPHAASVIYNAVGGFDIDARDPVLRMDVLSNLKAADEVGVRDLVTQAQLHAADIPTRLLPDPAVMVAELFGDDIRCRSLGGEAAAIRHAFPQGYLAVQFSADFGDDATLAEIALQLDELARTTGYGIAFFRAGTAPWHDELDCFDRVTARMRFATTRVFTPLDIWEICALIAASRGYLGSSLHGRIVAMAFALPRLNLVHHIQSAHSKQGAYAATWEDVEMPHVVRVKGMAQGMQDALETNAQSRRAIARTLAMRYRNEFSSLHARRFSLENI